jgi:hypothetical protein
VVAAPSPHHNPGRTPHKTFGPLTAVHAANVLTYESRGPGNGVSAGQIDAEYLGDLGLADRPDIWRMTLRENNA